MPVIHPSLLSTGVICDGLIGLVTAFVAMGIYRLARVPRLPFARAFSVFGLLLAASSASHFLAAWSTYHLGNSLDWPDALIKFVTALASLVSAFLFFCMKPHATKLIGTAHEAEKQR